jgi:hypothetical protein
MDALDSKLETEGLGRDAEDRQPLAQVLSGSNGELTHDLVEGESIHSDPRKLSKPASTVF